ncbi:hypothetical protein D3C83_265440 [compost metagenome]
MKQREDGVEVRAEAAVEMPQAGSAELRLELVEDVVEQSVRDLFVHRYHSPAFTARKPRLRP